MNELTLCGVKNVTMIEIRVLKTAKKDLQRLKKDPIKLEKYQALILSIKENIDTPLNGLGRPEALKGDLQGFYSRRLTYNDRLIYAITQEIIENEEETENPKILTIISILGHYEI